jgi:hypothetical protein
MYACIRACYFAFDAGMLHTEQAAPSAEGERVEGHGSPGHGRSGASLARDQRELRGFRPASQRRLAAAVRARG